MKYMLMLSAALLGGIEDGAVAQSPAHKQRDLVLAHRLVEWETKHLQNSVKAAQHAEALQKLGAEVKVDRHEGHADVRYRSPQWAALRVNTDELAHQWEDWLKAAGFETLHGHRPDSEEHSHHEADGHSNEHPSSKRDEAVLFRATAWGTQHFNSQADADQFATLAEALCCEVQKSRHSGHSDVRYRCPEWTAVEFSDHQSAEAWQKWLSSAGFEVRHDEHQQ